MARLHKHFSAIRRLIPIVAVLVVGKIIAANSVTAYNAYPQVGPFQNQGLGILDVRLGVLHQGFDVSAYLLNATNKDPLVGFSHSVSGDSTFSAAAVRPLTAGFTAYYRF